jgi:hypothetical protein
LSRQDRSKELSMNGNLKMAALTVGAAALLLGACGDDGGADRDEVIDRLVDEGESREVAECVVDEVGAGDVDRMMDADIDDVSDEDANELISAFVECDPGGPDMDADLDVDLDEMDLEDLDG